MLPNCIRRCRVRRIGPLIHSEERPTFALKIGFDPARSATNPVVVREILDAVLTSSDQISVERPRRDAIVAVSGASAASITSEVAIISAGPPR